MTRPLAILLLLLSACGPASGEQLTGRASVIDGDTIDIHGELVRLLDIDAPESRQTCTRPNGAEWRCGQEAALYLDHVISIAHGPVSCETKRKDRYGRWLARCTVEQFDLGLVMVSKGYAVPYRDCKCPQERAAAAEARAAGRGIHAGTYELPWEWRKRR